MKHPNFALKTLVISLSAAFAGQALAEDVHKTKIPRIDIIETASGAEYKQPGSVSVVTQEEICQRQFKSDPFFRFFCN